MAIRTTKRTPNMPAIIHRAAAQTLLALPARTFSRLEAEAVIIPSRRGKPGVPSEYDVREIVPAYLAYVKRTSGGRTARDRRDVAQAKLCEQRFAKEKGQLLDAADVEKTWSGHIMAVVAVLEQLVKQADTLYRAAHSFPDPSACVAAVEAELMKTVHSVRCELAGQEDAD